MFCGILPRSSMFSTDQNGRNLLSSLHRYNKDDIMLQTSMFPESRSHPIQGYSGHVYTASFFFVFYIQHSHSIVHFCIFFCIFLLLYLVTPKTVSSKGKYIKQWQDINICVSHILLVKRFSGWEYKLVLITISYAEKVPSVQPSLDFSDLTNGNFQYV